MGPAFVRRTLTHLFNKPWPFLLLRRIWNFYLILSVFVKEDSLYFECGHQKPVSFNFSDMLFLSGCFLSSWLLFYSGFLLTLIAFLTLVASVVPISFIAPFCCSMPLFSMLHCLARGIYWFIYSTLYHCIFTFHMSIIYSLNHYFSILLNRLYITSSFHVSSFQKSRSGYYKL